MGKLKELATSLKFWVTFSTLMVTTLVTTLVALGATVDRPIWKSEFEPLVELAGGNYLMILEDRRSSAQYYLWQLKDRYKTDPNPDLRQRIRDAEEALRKLDLKLNPEEEENPNVKP